MALVSDAIRVLHVDDEPDFADMAATFLEREDDRITVETATDAGEGLDHLTDHGADCVVSDYDMPGQNGIEFLEAVREERPDLPFILFTGKGSEEVASDAISAGVTDYLQKEGGTDQYAVLANRILNAVEKARVQRERQRQLDAIETAQEGISILDEDGHFLYVNQAYAGLYGYDPGEMIGEHWELLYRDEDVPEIRDEILPQVEERGHWHGTTTGLRADGSTFVEDHVLATTDYGELVCTVRDISDRKERERELERTREMLTHSEQLANVGTYEVDLVTREVTWSPGMRRIFEVSEEFEPTVEKAIEFYHPDDRGRIREEYEKRIETGEGGGIEEARIVTATGTERWIRGYADVVEVNGDRLLRGYVQDVTEREERERELEAARRRFDAVFHNPISFMALLDPDGTVVDVNEAALEFVDRSLDDVGGKPFWETPWWTHSKSLQDELRSWIERAAAGEVSRFEATHYAPDGDRVAIDGVLHPIRDDGGSVVSLLAAGRDISQRKNRERAIEALHSTVQKIMRAESPERVAEIVVDSVRDTLDMPINGVWFHDQSENVLDPAAWTDRSAEVVGESPIFRPGESLAWEVFETGESQHYGDVSAVSGRHNPDTTIRSEILLPLGDHGVIVIGSTEAGAFDALDVSLAETVATHTETALDGIEREARLRETSSRLEALFENSPDMIDVLDPDGVLLEVNRRFSAELGYNEEELIGTPIWEVDRPVGAEDVRALLSDLSLGERRKFEGRYERRDGSTFPVEVHLLRLDIDGEDRFMAISRDVTDRKAYERQLERQNERLNEFASVVSHDLRNPLNVAEGRLELVREECDSEHLDAILTAHDRMERIIDDVLWLAREGRDIGDTEPVDFGDAIEAAWSIVADGRDGIELIGPESEEGRPVTICADDDRLRQLLENLFRNAVDHGGPRVAVRVELIEEGFAVEDDGPGIPRSERERAFEAGYSTADEGTGFGLRIVDRVAEAHGWKVRVTDGVDGGARFEVTGVEFV